jgi:transcriptional regulator
MYIPAAFAKSQLSNLHDFMEQHSFGLLVSPVDQVPFATHLPFLLQRAAGANGALVGHMARANPQWREAAGQQALAIFSGPHTYISPTWYEAEQVVPTWNYTAVHAYGPIQIIEDPQALGDIVQALVQIYERSMARPWTFDRATTFAQKMLSQIVGFRIEIERLEGKWKLNQNQPPERRERVIRALSQYQGENEQAIAALMRADPELEPRRATT